MIMPTFDDDDPDKELKEKLEILIQTALEENPKPPPPPPPPLPLELQCEINVATNLLKLLFKSDPRSIIFSPSVILLALTSMIGDVDEKAGKEIEKICGKYLIYDQKYFKNLLYCNYLFYSNLLELKSSIAYGSNEFGDRFQSINFSDENKAVEKINSTVSANTNNKISTVIKDSDIIKDISIFLLNAAIFEAKFRSPFDEQKPGLFYSNPPRYIDMLYQKTEDSWYYSKGEDWTAIGIPYISPGGISYRDLKTRLYILLPKERDGLAGLIQKLDSSLIEKCLQGYHCDLYASIPAFEVESCINLNQHLTNLGFTKMFDKNSLSRLFSVNRPQGIDLAIHSSKIQVNRYGSFVEPFGYCRDSSLMIQEKVEFNADHPFIFFIADFGVHTLQSIHFIGTFL